ncbi:MAG: hypothetical protein JJE27_08705, partial [Thermoleophilia bacterium]|nr:hypothetical protein [Thermoleophilia bacterium]
MTVTAPNVLRSGTTYDEIETWSPEELRAWQFGLARGIVTAAAAGNRFYAEQW